MIVDAEELYRLRMFLNRGQRSLLLQQPCLPRRRQPLHHRLRRRKMQCHQHHVAEQHAHELHERQQHPQVGLFGALLTLFEVFLELRLNAYPRAEILTPNCTIGSTPH